MHCSAYMHRIQGRGKPQGSIVCSFEHSSKRLFPQLEPCDLFGHMIATIPVTPISLLQGSPSLALSVKILNLLIMIKFIWSCFHLSRIHCVSIRITFILILLKTEIIGSIYKDKGFVHKDQIISDLVSTISVYIVNQSKSFLSLHL